MDSCVPLTTERMGMLGAMEWGRGSGLSVTGGEDNLNLA